MDPQLAELIDAGEPDEPVAVLVRLQLGAAPPEPVVTVASFDRVVTGRVPRGEIVAVRAHPAVASMKAPEYLVPEPVATRTRPETAGAPSRVYHDDRRPDVPETGQGVVVALIDWGLDFAHPDFRHEDGTTRLLALWDQRGGRTPGSPPPYGYGVVHTPNAIDAALRASNPYSALRYDPADADPAGRGSHGTHCASIAAGNGRGGGPVGVAPAADLVFVHLTAGATAGLHGLGDSVTLLEALDFVLRAASGRPIVISLSIGNHGGPHDGSTLVEQAIDAAVRRRPGVAVAQSCGNYFARPIHASGHLRPGATAALDWTTDAADVTPNELEIWYPGVDVLGVQLTGPTGALVAAAPLREHAPVVVGRQEVGHLYHRSHEPNNGRNHVNVFLYANAPPGNWRLSLFGDDVADGRWHAWVERDAGCPRCQSLLRADESRPTATTGTICNGGRTIAVGAYDGHAADRPLAPFSSSGPTVDGRTKPDIVAPGVDVLAARSAPRGGRGGAASTRMSGTSMAAPHVAGTIALMFEAARQPLPIETTRRLLFRTAETIVADTAATALRAGDGYLAAAAAVDAARSFRPAPPRSTVVREAEAITAEAALPIETAPSYTLPPDPAQLRQPARTHVRAMPLFPAERVIDVEVDLLTRIAKRPDGWVYMANWHAEHDLRLPSGVRFENVLRACAAAGATIRGLFWSATPPPIRTVLDAVLASLPWWVPRAPFERELDLLVREALFAVFKEPLVNRRMVDFVNSGALPRAAAFLDNATLSFGSHHHKVLVVGNNEQTVAVLGGVDWNSDRLYVDPRQRGTPLFDVSVQVEGQAAADVAEFFELRWRADPLRLAVPLPVRRPPTAAPPSTGATAQLALNLGCGQPLTTVHHAITGASELIENMLENCQQFFYAEDQYGTGNPRLEASIRRAFANGARYGIVVLASTDAVSDTPEIAFHRHRFWTRFPQHGRNLLVFERLGDNGNPIGPHAYVHSKVVLVDDQAASIGTINLNRRSWRHDTEITALLADNPALVRDFRTNLWPYHLTVGPGDDIRDPAAAFRLWQAVYSGARPMQHVRPLHFTSVPPRVSASVAPVIAAALSALAPLPFPLTLAHVTAWVDQVMDAFHDMIIDPLGPLTC
jgi:phosphatidylserine/phosphatidylglycerophosphate/cardiolipin synthase-like enzyme/subtilisin family serine protease